MCASWNRNRLTERLGIAYPIIQGPLGGLSSQQLTAAVSNFGGLGSFGAHTLAPEAIASRRVERQPPYDLAKADLDHADDLSHDTDRWSLHLL